MNDVCASSSGRPANSARRHPSRNDTSFGSAKSGCSIKSAGARRSRSSAASMSAAPLHCLTCGETLQRYDTNDKLGLSSAAAAKRLAIYGENEIGGDEGPSVLRVLLSNTINPMNAVLLGALIACMAVHSWADGTVLIVIILANTMLGFRQEYKSERTMEALRKMSSPSARVLRDGVLAMVSANLLVPGDVVYLEGGDQVPADMRLFDAVNLAVNEALLTGEPVPVRKSVAEISAVSIPLGDRKNIVFKSTLVTYGRGHGVVFNTGLNTEIGDIAKQLSTGSKKRKVTPLERSMVRMMMLMAVLALIIAVVVFWLNHWNYRDLGVAMYAIATAIAILPEGLPMVTTGTMSLGVLRMAQQKAVVRKLVALEALGQVNNICSDKTGTLTMGRMSVVTGIFNASRYTMTGGFARHGQIIRQTESNSDNRKSISDNIITPENIHGDIDNILLVASLCTTCTLHLDSETDSYVGMGDTTELALTAMAIRLGYSKESLIKRFQFVAEFPFDSTLKRMTVAYRTQNGDILLLCKGAVESLQGLSTYSHCCCNIPNENIYHHLATDSCWQSIYEQVERMANDGLRVLALGWRIIPAQSLTDDFFDTIDFADKRDAFEREFIFGGLVGIMDPPRPETPGAIRACHQASILVHMITGDHPATATAIARQIGIIPPNAIRAADHVMTSMQFDSMTDAEIDALAQLPLVLARCSPTTKVKMVHALHRRGKFVAMTGDGVNDAPAIKQADVGISMGESGSEVTKQASDIILTDDNFATVVGAIAEGRRIFQNVAKFTLHLISGNVSEIVVLAAGLAFRDINDKPIFPMSPSQILFLNMVTSSPIALALGVLPAARNVMCIPPRFSRRNKKGAGSSNLFDCELIIDVLVYGVIMGALSLVSFILVAFVGESRSIDDCNEVYSTECEHVFRARAVSFTTLSILLLVHGFVCMSSRDSLFTCNASTAKSNLPINGELMHKRHFGSPLLWTVLGGLIIVAPLSYIPYLNTKIFHHSSFGFEWGYVCASVLIFILSAELYKLAKRRILGRHSTPTTRDMML